jgi:hypothetical protein
VSVIFGVRPVTAVGGVILVGGVVIAVGGVVSVGGVVTRAGGVVITVGGVVIAVGGVRSIGGVVPTVGGVTGVGGSGVISSMKPGFSVEEGVVAMGVIGAGVVGAGGGVGQICNRSGNTRNPQVTPIPRAISISPRVTTGTAPYKNHRSSPFIRLRPDVLPDGGLRERVFFAAMTFSFNRNRAFPVSNQNKAFSASKEIFSPTLQE